MQHVILPMPHEGLIAAAALRQDACFIRAYSSSGGFMGQVLDATRLLKALAPELEARLATAGISFTGTVCISTEIGTTTLKVASLEGAGGDSSEQSRRQFPQQVTVGLQCRQLPGQTSDYNAPKERTRTLGTRRLSARRRS